MAKAVARQPVRRGAKGVVLRFDGLPVRGRSRSACSLITGVPRLQPAKRAQKGEEGKFCRFQVVNVFGITRRGHVEHRVQPVHRLARLRDLQ